MKIGILTQPLTNNYGGIIQNFALQEILRSFGHEPYTMNISRAKAGRSLSVHRILSFVKRFVYIHFFNKRKELLFSDPSKFTNWCNTPQVYQKRFIEEYINVEECGYGPLTEKNDVYDAYIVGSDQVWRPIFSTYLPNYFLDFVGNKEKKKIAYAASFGVDDWELDESMTQTVAPLARCFDSISVREKSGMELCEKYLGVDSQVVLDPTLLIGAERYREIYKKKDERSYNGDYIGVYVLDITPHISELLKNLSEVYNIPVKFIGKRDGKNIPSIESWLEGIDNAKYVVTDSFHGSVFSIIFEKQFVALGNKERGMSRFDNLFSMFDIADRLCLNFNEVTKILDSKIDYNTLNLKKQELIKESIDYLKTNL